MVSTLHAIGLILGLSAGVLAKDLRGTLAAAPHQSQPGPMISAIDLRGTQLEFESEPPPVPDQEEPPTGRESAASPKARVEDVIFSTTDGGISFAVITISGTAEGRSMTVLVPARNLKLALNENRTSVSIRMTPAQVQAQPLFDLERARKYGVDVALEESQGAPLSLDAPHEHERSLQVAAIGREDPPEKTDGDGCPRFALTSQMWVWDVDASDKPLGRVKDVAIDTGRNLVAYFLVSRRDSNVTIIVPFAACACSRAGKDAVLELAKTSEELEMAPKYERRAKGFLTTDQTQRAEEFFGTGGPVEPPGRGRAGPN